MGFETADYDYDMKRHLERYHNNQNPTIDGVPIDINNIIGRKRNKITGRKRKEERIQNMDHGHDHGTNTGYSSSE